jgi:hypothetical protein
MLPAYPQVTCSRGGILRRSRSIIFVHILGLGEKEFIDFLCIKTGEVDVIVQILEVQHLQR